MKTKYNFDTTVTHKDATYQIRNNRLYEGKTRINYIDNAVLSNKIVRTYTETIKAAKYAFEKTDSFLQLVTTLTYVMSALTLLLSIKSWSTGKSRGFSFHRNRGKSTMEKFTEDCQSLIKNKLFSGNSYWHDPIWEKKNFSNAQRIVLHMLSDGFVGRQLHDWDFNDAYDAKKRSITGIKKLFAEIKGFNFSKYGVKKKPIVDECKQICEITLTMAAEFKKFTDIAGDDFINWGSHKIAAQRKKHEIKSRFGHGWIGEYQDSLKKKGIKLAPKKIKKKSMSERFYSTDETLSQDDLIKAFKAMTDNQATEVLRLMEVDTAVSLLEMKTKNVQDKMLDRWKRPTAAFRMIFDKVAEKENLDAFRKLRDYVRSIDYPEREHWNNDKNLDEYCTWQYLFTYSEHVSAHNYDLKRLPFTDISDEFFNEHFAEIKLTHRFKMSDSVTHAFLKRMTIKEKSKFLYLVEALEKMQIDWDKSAILFRDVKWNDLKKIIMEYCQWHSFTDLIVANNDSDFAVEILKGTNHINPDDEELKLYSLLSFDQKVENLKDRSIYHSDIKKIIGTDTEKFFKVAIEHSGLCHKIDAFNKVNINTLVANAEYPNVPDHFAKKLTQANLVRVFKNGSWAGGSHNHHTYYNYRRNRSHGIHTDLPNAEPYKCLNRKSYDLCFEHTPDNDIYADVLAPIMTADEFLSACGSHSFVRRNFETICNDIVAVKKLLRYHDKAEFKAIVGDRRDRANDNFGGELETKLKKISTTKLKLVTG